MYRASHYWPGIVELVPQMKAHLQVTKHRKTTGSGTDDAFSDQMTLTSEEAGVDFATAFKEHFCVAASELAEIIQEPLENLGVLFHSIMFTGTVDRPRRTKLFNRSLTTSGPSNAERGHVYPALGRGQLLFLVRLADRRDAAKLQAAGFDFAQLTNIMSSLAQSLEVSNSELSSQLHQIQKFLFRNLMLNPGVHLACFALRPKYPSKWDILINKDQKNLLPVVQLAEEELQPWHMHLIMDLNNMTKSQCFRVMNERMHSTQDREEKAYMVKIADAIDSLAAQIDPSLFEEARLLARPFWIPCRNLSNSVKNRTKAVLIMFRVIADVHYSSPINGRVEFGSSRLFLAQQHVYPGSPDHGAFARQVHREFADLADTQATSLASSGHSTPRRPSGASNMTSPDRKRIVKREQHPRSGHSKTRLGANKFGSRKQDQTRIAQAFFGGIHVQREISVDVSEIQDHHETEYSTKMSNLGVHSEASVALNETDTYADEMMAFIMEERSQQSLKRRNPQPSAR